MNCEKTTTEKYKIYLTEPELSKGTQSILIIPTFQIWSALKKNY